LSELQRLTNKQKKKIPEWRGGKSSPHSAAKYATKYYISKQKQLQQVLAQTHTQKIPAWLHHKRIASPGRIRNVRVPVCVKENYIEITKTPC